MTDQAPKRKTRGLGANQKAVIRAMEPGKGYSRHALQTLCNISIWQARSALRGLLDREMVSVQKPDSPTDPNLWRLTEKGEAYAVG